MIISPLALLVAVIGVLLYALTEGKLSEIGRVMFFVGMFVFVWIAGGKSVTLP